VLAYLLLPIVLMGLVAALTGSPWGAMLVLGAAFLGRALNGQGAVPDAIVAECVLLLGAFWVITGYLGSYRSREVRHPFLAVIGAAAGGLAGAVILPGVDFALLAILGGMAGATIACTYDLTRFGARFLLLEPLRILTVMAAAFWLMFHLS